MTDRSKVKVGELPERVTDENWQQFKDEGFVWQKNMVWPLSQIRQTEGESDRQYVDSLRRQYGAENVKFGDPINYFGRPDARSGLVGLYLRKTGMEQNCD